MKRLGRYKAEANAETRRRHLKRPPEERIIDSLCKSDEYRTPAALARHFAEDNPGALYDRARKLGLIRTGTRTTKS